MATVKKYIFEDGEMTESVSGHLVGVTWEDIHGNFFKCVFSCFQVFDMLRKIAKPEFYKYIKPVGLDTWIYQKAFTTNVDTNEYRYTTLDIKFGTIEPEPFDGEGNIKAGLVTEADFFIMAVFQGQFGVFPLDSVLVQTICELNEVTID